MGIFVEIKMRTRRKLHVHKIRASFDFACHSVSLCDYRLGWRGAARALSESLRGFCRAAYTTDYTLHSNIQYFRTPWQNWMPETVRVFNFYPGIASPLE